MRIDPRENHLMQRPLSPAPSRRIWLQLLSALIDLAQGMAELIQHSERPWSSATFSGTRHTITFQFTGEEAVLAGEEFVARLEEHEFTLPRVLVADAAIAAADHEVAPVPRLTVIAELLLLDEE